MASSTGSTISSEDERERSAQLAMLSPPLSPRVSQHGSRSSSPQRAGRCLPSTSAVGATLQSTVEDLLQRDLLDAGVAVELANSKEAHQKLEDLLPIHFYSWRLKNVEAALIYTLLHVFVLVRQYAEMAAERGAYEDYIDQLKARLSQLEDERLSSSRPDRPEREEIARLRRENAELRQEKAKLQASQNELFQINDAWSRDYQSLTQKVEALTSGRWSSDLPHLNLSNGTDTHTQPPPTSTTDEHCNARTPTHPPSLSLTDTSHKCHQCHSLKEQLTQLSRQVKDLSQTNRDLEKLLEDEERKIKQKDMIIKSLDSENQAVQLQIQEIGDLHAAVRQKEEFRKLELKMRQLEQQHQDTTSKKIQLQQQVDKLRYAFMSILGVSSRRHFHHDCRLQQYMSEPLPPPPTPPGLIARGNHLGSLVETDRQLRVLFDEQVTGFERATPHQNMSLPSDTRSWPQVTQRTQRPNTLLANGHIHHGNSATKSQQRIVPCPSCKAPFDICTESGFTCMFDHVSYCGPKTAKSESNT